MNKALANAKGTQLDSFTTPLNDNQFRNFLDSEGKIKCARELRIAVYRRGVEPSLRKVVWKHLLNVYPSGLTGQQRIDFMKLKCETYCQMRNLWQVNQNDPIVENIIHTVGIRLFLFIIIYKLLFCINFWKYLFLIDFHY
jgi:hypothetical protein